MENTCPVCNYNALYEPAYNIKGYGSDEICPCCGFQFGYDDYPNKEESHVRWRENWIRGGCLWYSKSRIPPKGWDVNKQLNK